MPPAPVTDARLALVVMGVAGSGKSTVGAALAAALHLPFVDGDSLHSTECVAKMRAGTPLDDADRAPWLDRIGARLADRSAAPGGIVIACSALKRVYRDRLREAAPGLRFVFLDGTEALLASRLGARQGHYMSPSMLRSQLATLEQPGADEADTLRCAIDAPVEAIAGRIAAALREGAVDVPTSTPSPPASNAGG